MKLVGNTIPVETYCCSANWRVGGKVVRALSTDLENRNVRMMGDSVKVCKGNGTNLHQMTRGICRDDFPYRIRSARVYAQVVECVSALPGLRLLNTLRTEKGFGRMKYKFNNEPPPNCISPENCCDSIIKHWLSQRSLHSMPCRGTQWNANQLKNLFQNPVYAIAPRSG